ncbi:MAG: peptide ABC transporter substrate-binding protein [Anaerolineae bacterium]
MNKFVRVVGLALLVVALTAVGLVHAQDVKVLNSSLHMVGGDLETIDPGLSEASSSIEVVNQIFVGLTNQNVLTAEPGLGLATGYDVSEDGKTFTFKLMDNVPWVRYNADSGAVEEIKDDAGNVRMVTAQDVVYGILRALNPETASPYSYILLPYVVGAAEYNAGTGSADDVMVKATDDNTVEITSPDAFSFAPSIYGLWVARAVPSWAIDEAGDAWTEPENIASNGPFALKEWNHDESIVLIKNPYWPGSADIPQPKLDEVVLRFLDPAQAFAEYQAGNLDAADVPLESLEQVKSDPVLSTEYNTGSNPCTYYIGFDNTTAPSDNVHLRRALSFAIDRQSIVDNVTKGGQIPAQWFARPGLTAAPTLEQYPDLGVKYDTELAKAELELAKADMGGEIPQLTFTYNDNAGHAAIAQAIQQMWKDTLGLDVQLSAVESTGYFSKLSEDAPMIYRAGWCQDYSDASNFDDVFESTSSQNDPGYNNPEFDKLIQEARLETDVAKRTELYAQAEQIFSADDAGIAPIYWYTRNYLVKPNVEQAKSVTGNEAYFLWDKS